MAKRKKRFFKPAGEAKQKPKTRPPTETERKMGQIVLDFANAETTDAACFKHFENMQEFMPFSPDFVEGAKEKFPAFYPLYHSLTKEEIELLKLIKQEEQTKDSINKYLKDQELGCIIQRHDAKTSIYDPETSILRVWTLDPHSELHNSLLSAGFSTKRGDTRFEMTVDEFKDEIKDSVRGISQGGFLSDLDEFVEIGKKISTLKARVSSSRPKELMQLFEEYSKKYPLRRVRAIGSDEVISSSPTSSEEFISDLSEYFWDIGSLHARLEYLQEALRVTLRDILSRDALSSTHYYLEIFLEKYNDLPKFRIEFSDTGLMEVPPLNEEEYINTPHLGFINKRTTIGTTVTETGWFNRFEDDLVYCLIEFLFPDDNKKYISKCLNCEKYFIAGRYTPTNPQKFCKYNGDDCKRDWHNRRRIKSGEAAKYKREKRKEGAKPSYYG